MTSMKEEVNMQQNNYQAHVEAARVAELEAAQAAAQAALMAEMDLLRRQKHGAEQHSRDLEEQVWLVLLCTLAEPPCFRCMLHMSCPCVYSCSLLVKYVPASFKKHGAEQHSRDLEEQVWLVLLCTLVELHMQHHVSGACCTIPVHVHAHALCWSSMFPASFHCAHQATSMSPHMHSLHCCQAYSSSRHAPLLACEQLISHCPVL